MSFGSRLRDRREELGLKQSELGKMLGVTGSAIGNYENGVSSPKADILNKVFNVLKCDANYLFQDEMKELETDDLTVPEIKHIKKYRLLDPYGKEAVDGVIDVESRRCQEERQKQAAILREQREQLEAAAEIALDASEMLVYINPAAAGTPLYAESDFERIEFPSSEVPRGTDFGIRISGRSMEPTFMDGSIVWVRKRLDIPNGAVGIFMLNDSAVCKRFFKEPDGTVRLESDNPEFPGVPITEFDTFVVVGEVVGMV